MRTGLSAVMLIAGLSWAGGTAAQGEPGGESYEQLLKKGEAAVIGSDWKACVGHFERARELRPDDPLAYLAIGRCSLEDGDNIKAFQNLQRGMQQQSLSEKQRARAESLLKRARQRVGVYTFKLSPESARASIAGKPVQLDEEGRKLLEAGRYDEAQAQRDRVSQILGPVSAKIAKKSGGYRFGKGLSAALGRPVGPPRPPTLAMDEQEIAELREAVKELGWLDA